MRAHFLTSFLCAGALASTAVAEVPKSAVDEARAETFLGRMARVQYAVEENGEWDLVSVFARPFDVGPLFQTGASGRWVLRRQASRGGVFPSSARWADSATCPQIEGVLWALSRLTVPSFDVPDITPELPDHGTAPDLATVDGPVFSIWGDGFQPSGASAFISFSGLGGELTQWGVHAERELAACWSEQPPTE